MRKIACTALAAVEIAALIGAYALDYYSHAKLGMNRWLVYHSQVWEQALPIPAIEFALVGLLFALLALVLVLFAKAKVRTPLPSVACFLSVLLLAGTSVFIIACDTVGFRAYYLMCVMLAAASAMQVCWYLVVAKTAKR